VKFLDGTSDYQRALITGASSGLGRGLSSWFARRGVQVFAAARRVSQLETLRDEVPGRIVPVEMDVSRTDALVGQIQKLDEECGGFDLVIANAGIGEDTYAQTPCWPAVERTLQVNVMGAAATLVAALGPMVKRNRGHLVAVSSVAAFRGLPRNGAYCASKAFLRTFLESMRVDLRGTQLKVTTLYPGYVKTELTARNRFHMPFLMELDDACERMGRAIRASKRTYILPVPMAVVSYALRALPGWLYERLAAPMSRRQLKGS
jgi:short-subunit dehydrogenase